MSMPKGHKVIKKLPCDIVKRPAWTKPAAQSSLPVGIANKLWKAA